jgi:hypothetical protein
VIQRPGPTSLSLNSDIIDRKSYIDTFLKNLRANGALLTYEEFATRDRKAYVEKRDQIGRIQGTQFIEECIRKHNLKHIKVPKKIAVIQQGVQSLTFRFDSSLEIQPPYMEGEDMIKVYAEKITPSKRTLSLEEAIEWMIALETTGFNDFAGENFFITEDGIYFIDTEYSNFTPTKPRFDAIQTLSQCLDKKDVPQFMKEFEKRKSAFNKEPYVSSSETLTALTQSHKFTFDVATLLS